MTVFDKPLRLAQAGPVFGNQNGAQATPGNGFPLRIGESDWVDMGALTLDGTQQQLPVAVGFLQAALPLPDPDKRYKAFAIVNPFRSADGGVSIDFAFNWNAGGGYAAGPVQKVSIGQVGVSTSFSQVVLESPMVLGSALADPVQSGALSLGLRLSALEASGNTVFSSAAAGYIKLVESL